MLRNFLETRRVRRAFERMVSPETVEALLQDREARQPLKAGCIEFILTFVGGANPAEVAERVGKVADLALAHEAVVHDIVGPLVIIAFGTSPSESPKPGSRASLLGALRGQLAGELKILHGAADGHYGLFGGNTRMAYTFLVPHFDKMLGNLSRLKFGEVEEFHP